MVGDITYIPTWEDAGSYPYGVAADPAAHIVYVTNSGSGSVSVIDEATDTVTATIHVGSRPYGMALDPAARTAYVANSGSGTVSVIQMCGCHRRR